MGIYNVTVRERGNPYGKRHMVQITGDTKTKAMKNFNKKQKMWLAIIN